MHIKSKRRRRRRRRNKKPRLFPRLDVPGELAHYFRLLRTTYNVLAARRQFKLRYFNYDVFRGKRGGRAAIAFLDLARILKDNDIDPSRYLKVMSKFGRYREATWMPSPVWFAKTSTVEKYKWVYRRMKRAYDLKLDFKKELRGWSVLDIYSSIRDSASMFHDAVDKAGLHPDQAIVMLKKDLSPWFMVTSLLVSPDRKDFLRCLDLLRRDRKLKKMAIKAFRRKSS